MLLALSKGQAENHEDLFELLSGIHDLNDVRCYRLSFPLLHHLLSLPPPLFYLFSPSLFSSLFLTAENHQNTPLGRQKRTINVFCENIDFKHSKRSTCFTLMSSPFLLPAYPTVD